MARDYAATTAERRYPESLVNIDAEREVLGGILCNNDILHAVLELVDIEDFYELLHQRILFESLSMIAEGKIANPVTLRPLLINDPALNELGGPAYLAVLTESRVISPKFIYDFAMQVADLAKRRRLYDEFRVQSEAIATIGDASIGEVASNIDVAIAKAVARRQVGNSMTLGNAVDKTWRSIEDDVAGRKVRGVETSFIPDWNQLTGTMRPGEFIVLGARPSMGKAQPLDAKVLTPNGWTMMGQLEVGQAIAGPDGRPSRVTAIFPQGPKEIFRVSFSDGRSAECCAEHLWKVRFRKWKHDRVVSTLELATMLKKPQYRGRLSVDLVTGDFGVRTDLLIDPWLLGALLGDGDLQKGAVRFSNADDEVIAKVRTRLPCDLQLHSAGGADYRISGGQRGGTPNALLDALRAYGLAGTVSETKFVPRVYLEANRDVRSDVLRGLLDTDGWVEKSGTVRFSSASRQLALDVQYLVRSLGGVCRISVKEAPQFTSNGIKKTGLAAYLCTVRHPNAEEFLSLTRKAQRAIRKRHTVRLSVESIEPTRITEAQCISVSHPDRLYVTDDFVVTHNTATATSVALGAADKGAGVLFISLEMDLESITERMMADLLHWHRATTTYQDVQNGNIAMHDQHIFDEVRRRAAELPLIVVDPPSLTAARLPMVVRRYQREMEARGQRLDLVVLDYMQMMKGSKGQDRFETVTEISQISKATAKECGIAMLALSQLSRAVEQREDKRPQLSDLRESGQIEQDADTILFLYREEYYLERTKPRKTEEKRHAAWEEAMQAASGRLEIICAKRRKGRIGSRNCHFFGAHQAVRGSNFFQAKSEGRDGE